MKRENKMLAKARLIRLRDQGYTVESDQYLSDMAFGIRFAYRFCVIIIIAAIATQSLALFSLMLCIAFFGVVLPNHPFDYVYNATLSRWMHKPKLPPRTGQLKFACFIATLCLAVIVNLLYLGYSTAPLTLASFLAFTALLPSITDLCIPSMIYNTIYLKLGTAKSTDKNS